MPSTFFGLTIGASGLNSFQVAVNTTANNISNVQTDGYTRQNATLEATEALRVYARYGSTGSGVAVTSIRQERNLYYDTKYWENNSNYGYYEQKLYYLDQIQTTFADDSTQNGFATIFAKMFNSLDTLISDGASEATARNQFLNNAQSLCTYFNALSTELDSIQEDCNEEVKSVVDNINAISEKIALLNKEINQVEVGTGAEASDLRDERANLIDELSELVSVETEEFEVQNSNGDENLGGTNYRVIINGQLLVENGEYRTLKCEAVENKHNFSDIEGLYDIKWSDTNNDFACATATAGGKLKALLAIRDGDNEDCLTGKVVMDGDNQAITITNPSITDLKALNLTDYQGTVTVKNRKFDYDSWEATLDDEGNITSITFNLTEPMSDAVAEKIDGGTLTAGSNVDAMGVPYYKAQINQFIRTFAELFNDIEEGGVDLNGNPATDVFVGINSSGDEYDYTEWQSDEYDNTVSSIEGSYFRLTAGNVAIDEDMLKDPDLFSTAADITNGVDAYDIVTKLKTLQSDVIMFRGDDASSFLETLISDVSVDTEKAEIFNTNYSNLQTTIDNQRTSISGVDEDEEALNLIKFQNAYNLNSKVISVMSELYDKLINETGV